MAIFTIVEQCSRIIISFVHLSMTAITTVIMKGAVCNSFTRSMHSD